MATSASPAPDAAPLVRFRQVSKHYGSQCVVDAMDLDIRRGEFLTLLGPSGSGKTTSLMMLAGFEQPSAGSIEMAGQRIDTVPAHRRDIGVVFQNYALFPHLTVAQNLAFPLQARRVPAAEVAQRVQQALDMVHLGALGQRKPAQLSGGQQQRIALARALIFRPGLVVLDEPLGALDKNLREHMQLELKRMHRELGLTMVFVTHDQSEALTLSDRVAVFNHGRIQQIDTPQRLYNAPATHFVASFIGENNLLPAQLVDQAGGVARLRLPDGGLLPATAAPGLANGRPVCFGLRPEQLELETGEASAGDTRRHSLHGSVRELIFLGDQTKLVVQVDGVGELVARISTRFGQQAPAVGQPCTLSYWIDLARVFEPAATG